MKRFFLITFLCVGLAISSIWFLFPQSMAKALLTLNNYSAGVSEKTIDTKIGQIHYLEGGADKDKADTVVLLHGIFARKEHWVDLIRHLEPDFHVIALDLPGFGNNLQLKDNEYRLNKQASNLALVLEQLNVKNAHVGANSMGAQVAALVATQRPELFKSLAFIGSPLGVKSAIQSEMESAIKKGYLPLVVQSEKAFHARNEWLFPETPSIPSPILKTWMQQELNTPVKNKQIWYSANSFINTPKLLEVAPKLLMPSLIIWCKEDKIFHVSGANALQNALPDSRKEIMHGCGHVPMLDKPEQVADLYVDFLRKL
ncbi:alpha/beta fold hydrolase [Alteromonas flava]|uniref:alpha/beta fold hydrolase n=1 Tax=Alteromonas flava TaxID=2048003 RepID=UPI0013DC49B4|nr:alpha/beta hydrolase [Alteromonas flava]